MPALGSGRDQSMKLLVVEDDKEAAAYLRRALSEAGHVVDVAAWWRNCTAPRSACWTPAQRSKPGSASPPPTAAFRAYRLGEATALLEKRKLDGTRDHRAGDGHPLALAAGHLVREAVLKAFEADRPGLVVADEPVS